MILQLKEELKKAKAERDGYLQKNCENCRLLDTALAFAVKVAFIAEFSKLKKIEDHITYYLSCLEKDGKTHIYGLTKMKKEAIERMKQIEQAEFLRW